MYPRHEKTEKIQRKTSLKLSSHFPFIKIVKSHSSSTISSLNQDPHSQGNTVASHIPRKTSRVKRSMSMIDLDRDSDFPFSAVYQDIEETVIWRRHSTFYVAIKDVDYGNEFNLDF